MPDAVTKELDAPEAPIPSAPPSSPSSSPPVPRARRRTGRRLVRLTLLLLVPLLVLAGAGYVVLSGGRFVSTDNAYVKADKTQIATDVAGTVAEVAVRENQRVEAGQLLFRLDDEPYRIALAHAEAQIGTVQTDLAALKASYRQKQEDIRQAEADIQFYQREFQRQSDLAQRSFASQAALDKARHDLDSARQNAAGLRQELASIAANLGGGPDVAIEQHPRYKAAIADRDRAARDLRRTVVNAPTAGIVSQVDSLQPGAYLAAAQPAFVLVASDHVWVEANPKETDLTYVRPGQTATVGIDAYPGVEWTGTVETLSPASGAEFALLPAQNTSGNWVKVVQRIPLRVRIDQVDGRPPLRAGMSAEVEIDTGHKRQLPTFLARIFGANPFEGGEMPVQLGQAR